jgi:hypothetical protein
VPAQVSDYCILNVLILLACRVIWTHPVPTTAEIQCLT